MIFFILLFLFQIGSTILFNLITPNNPWFLFLWIPCGIISGYILLVISIFTVFYPILKFTKLKSKFKHNVIYSFCWFAMKFLRVNMKVIGRENIPSETFVVYGNHKSMMDVPAVYVAFHSVMSAVAKNTLAKVKLINMFMKTAKVIPLDRQNERQGVKDLMKAIALVEDGYNFMIFPEGGIKTRETEQIVETKPGAFKLATKPKATIVPISIIGTSRCKKLTPWHKVNIKLVIHKGVSYDFYKDLTTQEISDYVVNIINEGVING